MSKSSIQPIPQGFNTATAMIMADGIEPVINFLQKAFDAQINDQVTASDGKIWHCSLKIGDSMIMLGDSRGMHDVHPAVMYLYVKDANAAYQKAVNAGGKSIEEPKDRFYGDHAGAVLDPAGNAWWIATRVEEVPQDELERRAHKEEAKMKAHTGTQKKAA